ncbi:MAG: P1 family peptidase [Bacteroidota bacterium]
MLEHVYFIRMNSPSSSSLLSTICKTLFFLLCTQQELLAQSPRARELGIEIGILPTGALNAITDVAGVKVGHVTLVEDEHIRTGVTAILPHPGNIFQEKVPAAMYLGNGFGKLMGYSQVEELGNIETPIILTNTLSVPMAAEGLIDYTLRQPGNERVRSVNPIVGETNDGRLNDIRGRHVRPQHIIEAIEKAKDGAIAEGAIGAGTGTICFGFKGGMGTASRKLPKEVGGYTVGVLVQSNFGGVLEIDGVPVGVELNQYYMQDQLTSSDSADGSIMVVLATDAPVDSRNLKRMAKRAVMGIAKTGGIASNGSGDYVIAFSTFEQNFVTYTADTSVYEPILLRNAEMSPLFLATIEATEEAIVNSLIASSGYSYKGVKGLPVEKVQELMKSYGRE